MADTDKDGALDEPEFIIALHLVQTMKRGAPIPSVLPPDFINTVRRGMKSPGPPRKPSLVADDLVSPPPQQQPPPISSPPMVAPVATVPPIHPPMPTQTPSVVPMPVMSPPVAAPPPTHVPSMPILDGWVVRYLEHFNYTNIQVVDYLNVIIPFAVKKKESSMEIYSSRRTRITTGSSRALRLRTYFCNLVYHSQY